MSWEGASHSGVEELSLQQLCKMAEADMRIDLLIRDGRHTVCTFPREDAALWPHRSLMHWKEKF